MKHRSENSNERSIVRILLLAFVVLSISTLVCILYVQNIKKCFRNLMLESTYENVLSSSKMLEDETNNILDNLVQVTSLLDSRSDFSQENLFDFLKRCCDMNGCDAFYFVRHDGTVFGSDSKIGAVSKERYAANIKVEKPTVRVIETQFAKDDRGSICYMIPSEIDKANAGIFIAVYPVMSIIPKTSFTTLEKDGDIFLISSEGKIFAQLAKQFDGTNDPIRNVTSANIFTRLQNHAADQYSRKRIGNALNKMRSAKYCVADFVCKEDNQIYYLQCRNVDNSEGIYIAYVYPESMYTKELQPVIFNALVVGIIIISGTLLIFLYVWGSSKKANEMVSSLAYDDPVTGGKNENYFRKEAALRIHENRNVPYLIARFDIVNFRYINEAYGHARADELLSVVSMQSKEIFSGREFCSRMTADQFLLLGRNDKEFDNKFEDLERVINEGARGIGIKYPIKLKCGIYQIRKEDSDISIIIDKANMARKSLSGDEKKVRAIYSEKITQKAYELEKIESDMENALRNGEFKVYIQPKWDIFENKVCGGEALVRWEKEDGTTVMPDQFIPIFEKNGFVEKLDFYMLEEVCKIQRKMMDENRRIYPISVNQSRVLLHNPEYVNQVLKILKRYRIPSRYLELELTETVFLDERELMINVMNMLKLQNITILMDDFGSGYSSLNILKDIPFDIIKIDREFFSESITSKTSILILSKIVEMAHGLGAKVVCEGVESEKQVKLLKQIECHYVQGYYYGKPMYYQQFIDLYSNEIYNGKEYYQTEYEESCTLRDENLKKDAEKKGKQTVESAVESFKKNYTSSNVSSKDLRRMDEDKQAEDLMALTGDSLKGLSTEEQKLLARSRKEESDGK